MTDWVRPGRLARRLALLAAPALLVIGIGAAFAVQPAAAAPTTLRQAADVLGLKVGTAVTASTLTGNAKYGATTAREFNAITPGNEMKWGSIEPTRGQLDWTGADATVAFATANNQVVRGHTLLWHNQLPGWLTSGGFNAADLTAIVHQHIATEVGRYKGRLISWDVVNEPFNEDGTLRSTVFSTTLGPGYIADALTQARAADPAAKLYINDFNIEGINAKSTAMLNLVTSLKQQGVPIDGVGIQTHLILGQVPSDFAQNIARFTAAGFDVWLSEVDVRMTLPATPAMLAQQASDYTKIVNACLSVKRCVGITVWGFTDLDSWVPGTFPGQGAADIFDTNMDPKPAYSAVLTALGGAPQATPTPTFSEMTPTPTPPAIAITPVVASGSPWFNEEDLRIGVGFPGFSALTVTVVVQRTAGVSFGGQYNTVGGQIQQHATSTASTVTYTFTLASGQTLSPGSYTFAAQTGGSGTAHPTSGDTFTVDYTVGTLSLEIRGHF
jgi:endo-1,4-beta-xylanase